jgi:hypothetical protein
MNDIAVVTAVTGGYDYSGGHLGYRSNVDYLFYTDGIAEPPEPEWRKLLLPNDFSDDPWKLAKLPKIAPHLLSELQNYRYVIWIDGSMQIKSSLFVSELLSYLDHGLVLSPHFDNRDCGYGEATIRPEKYSNQPLDEQCDFYRSEGFPEHYGLWECGVQARDMSVPLVREFGSVWMNEILRWSVQDQVSCGYSLWKTGLVPDVLEKSWRYYDWLHINAHRREVPWAKE